MMRAALVLIFIGSALGCFCYSPVSEPDSGAAGTDGGSSTGGADGGSCGFNLTWQGDHCVAPNCAVAPETVPCVLGDGGFGACFGGRCQVIDPNSSDPNNCGWFGYSCPQGTLCKGGHCEDSTSDLATCDSSACLPGEVCIGIGGASAYCIVAYCDSDWDGRPCLVAPPDFSKPGICCGTSCVVPDTNDHCGGCGVVCAAGHFCEFSTNPPNCRAAVDCATATGELECPLPNGSDGHCCHGACTDVGQDELNCGGCGQACPLAATCVSTFYFQGLEKFYSCRPDLPTDAGNLLCPGGCPRGRNCVVSDQGGARCVTTQCTTATEGDACGNYGSPLGPWVDNTGTLSLSRCCSSTCSELNHDPLNCGRCGEVCPRGTFCNEGACVGEVDCQFQANDQCCALGSGETGICCEGTCVDPRSDPRNCASCANACPTGTRCQEASVLGFDRAVCLTDDGGLSDCNVQGCDPGYGCDPTWSGCFPLTCGEKFGPCAHDPGADAGYFEHAYCCAGVCGPQTPCQAIGSSCEGRLDGERCEVDGGKGPPWGLCCNQMCVDPTRDPNNCGGCGLPCDACVQGGCLPEGPAGDCKATCGFGTICAAGGVCVDSTCWGYQGSFGFCLAQTGNMGTCCRDERSCADVRNDPFNCGGCGVACATGQSCVHGACQ